jgi:hypothetical protein
MQNLVCIYTGWFLVAGLAVFVPVMLRMQPGAFGLLKQFVRENKGKVFRIVGLWSLAMLALFLPYVLVNFGIGRGYSESARLMPTPSAWITGPPDSKWSVTTSPYRAPVSSECWLFSGFTIYLLMLAAVISLFISRNERTVERAIIGAAMATVAFWMLATLTPNPGGESLWWVVRFLPGGMAIRCVSRVYLVVYLFGSIAGLTWLTQVTSVIGREWLRFAVQAIVVGALIFEQTEYQQPSFERKSFYPLVDKAAEQLNGAEVGWVVPHYTDTNKYSAYIEDEVFAMWVGLRANVPVVNGYSGREPTDFPRLGTMTEEKMREWLKGKYRGKVRIVDPLAPPGQQVWEIVVE